MLSAAREQLPPALPLGALLRPHLCENAQHACALPRVGCVFQVATRTPHIVVALKRTLYGSFCGVRHDHARAIYLPRISAHIGRQEETVTKYVRMRVQNTLAQSNVAGLYNQRHPHADFQRFPGATRLELPRFVWRLTAVLITRKHRLKAERPLPAQCCHRIDERSTYIACGAKGNGQT